MLRSHMETAGSLRPLKSPPERLALYYLMDYATLPTISTLQHFPKLEGIRTHSYLMHITIPIIHILYILPKCQLNTALLPRIYSPAGSATATLTTNPQTQTIPPTTAHRSSQRTETLEQHLVLVSRTLVGVPPPLPPVQS